MKNAILTLTIAAFIAGTFSTSYGLEPVKNSLKTRENLQETQINMVATKLDVKEPLKNTISEYQKFMKDSEIKISNHKRCFVDYKALFSKINRKDKTTCQNKVNKLEQKNNSLKNKLDIYRNDKRQDKRTTFKSKFNHDLNKLEIQMWSVN